MLQRKEHRYKNLLKALSEEQLVFIIRVFFTVEDTCESSQVGGGGVIKSKKSKNIYASYMCVE